MIGRWGKATVPEVAKSKGFDDFDLRLGDLMRGERATLGKSLLDVQRELKIKATYIAAIENADVGAFETPGFIAGYVRSYARYLGMEPEHAFARFCTESGFAVAHGMSAAASFYSAVNGTGTHKTDLNGSSVNAETDPGRSYYGEASGLTPTMSPNFQFNNSNLYGETSGLFYVTRSGTGNLSSNKVFASQLMTLVPVIHRSLHYAPSPPTY